MQRAEAAFKDLHCPISLELPEDPVAVVACRHLFDAPYLVQVIESRSFPVCPSCRGPLARDFNSSGYIWVTPVQRLVRSYNWMSLVSHWLQKVSANVFADIAHRDSREFLKNVLLSLYLDRSDPLFKDASHCASQQLERCSVVFAKHAMQIFLRDLELEADRELCSRGDRKKIIEAIVEHPEAVDRLGPVKNVDKLFIAARCVNGL